MKPNYPSKEGHKSAGFGWASDCMAIAVNHDDAEGFIQYAKECGGFDVEVLISGDLFNYAATHGATQCLKALFKVAGDKAKYDLDYYLAKAEKPSYGPRAARLQPSPV